MITFNWVNCFSTRPPLKWFKDDSDIVQSMEIIKETAEEINVARKQARSEPIVIEELKEELIVEESTRKELITKKDVKEKSTNETNLKMKIISNKSPQQKADIAETKNSILSESFNFEENSCSSEDFKSDYEMKASKSPTTPLVKEMDQKSLQKFYAKTEKQRPGQDLIDRVSRGRYFKMNQIFNEPSKVIPLPRRSGIINVTFSERAFPTPARESSHIEEQEVR